MPCASVSEKPTRVKLAYLNGGLRAGARPRSSGIRARAASGASAHPLRERRQPAAGLPPAEAADQRRADEDQDHRAENRERDVGEVRRNPLRAGTAPAVTAVPLGQEVVGAHDAGLFTLGREERPWDHRVDEPSPVDPLQRHGEGAGAGTAALLRLQDDLDPELVSVAVRDYPAVERLSGRGEGDARKVALVPLLAAHAETEVGRDAVVTGVDVLSLDDVVHERVHRRVDLLPFARSQPLRRGRSGGEAEQERYDRSKKQAPRFHGGQISCE